MFTALSSLGWDVPQASSLTHAGSPLTWGCAAWLGLVVDAWQARGLSTGRDFGDTLHFSSFLLSVSNKATVCLSFLPPSGQNEGARYRWPRSPSPLATTSGECGLPGGARAPAPNVDRSQAVQSGVRHGEAVEPVDQGQGRGCAPPWWAPSLVIE